MEFSLRKSFSVNKNILQSDAKEGHLCRYEYRLKTFTHWNFTLENWIELEVSGKNHIWIRQIKAKILISRLKLFLRNVSLPVLKISIKAKMPLQKFTYLNFNNWTSESAGRSPVLKRTSLNKKQLSNTQIVWHNTLICILIT